MKRLQVTQKNLKIKKLLVMKKEIQFCSEGFKNDVKMCNFCNLSCNHLKNKKLYGYRFSKKCVTYL